MQPGKTHRSHVRLKPRQPLPSQPAVAPPGKLTPPMALLARPGRSVTLWWGLAEQ